MSLCVCVSSPGAALRIVAAEQKQKQKRLEIIFKSRKKKEEKNVCQTGSSATFFLSAAAAAAAAVVVVCISLRLRRERYTHTYTNSHSVRSYLEGKGGEKNNVCFLEDLDAAFITQSVVWISFVCLQIRKTLALRLSQPYFALLFFFLRAPSH